MSNAAACNYTYADDRHEMGGHCGQKGPCLDVELSLAQKEAYKRL